MALDFQNLLYQMQEYKDVNDNDSCYPKKANLLPAKGATICNIDLDNRTIEAPSILSVQFDHNAEVIYFRCARYFDNVDLANMACIVEYVNADGDAGMYWVPCIDINHVESTTNADGVVTYKDVMYIPWAVQGLATAQSGFLTFAVRFYKIRSDGTYLYSLRTQPAKGQILHGLDLSENTSFLESESAIASSSEQIYQAINQARNEAITYSQENAITYWVDL